MRAVMRFFLPLTVTGTLLLSACSGAVPGNVGSTGARPTRLPSGQAAPVRRPVRRPLPQAQVQMLPGLEGVIGSSTAELTRQFGAARLDVWEGDARKLQFTGPACVLDVYLYPPAQDREPQATYVDARRTDGKDVDRAACVQALRKR